MIVGCFTFFFPEAVLVGGIGWLCGGLAGSRDNSKLPYMGHGWVILGFWVWTKVAVLFSRRWGSFSGKRKKRDVIPQACLVVGKHMDNY